MIEKERLEELIKESASVYHEFKGDIFKIDLSKIKKYAEIAFEYYNEYYKCGITLTISDLYETKEEAEFALKYQNITRTETLSLPTWEEFEQKSYFDFIASDGRNIIIEKTLLVDFEEEDCLSDFNLVVSDWNDYSHKALFRGDYTKESYTKACELCKKLFLGEEV